MAEILVRPLAEREFEVEVRDGGRSTVHRVTVPGGFAAELGAEDRMARAVHESFVFLLEREPSTSILARFSLDDIARYFPDYPRDIRRRLG